jgi:hypothetical protein
VNHHSVCIWGMENHHAMVEHFRDSPKVNVFRAISSCKVYGPFFFAEPSVTGINYLDMLQLWLMPQLREDSKDFIFQQDGATPHFHFDVRAHLTANLPGHWIGHASDSDSPLLPWPSWSPDLTPPPPLVIFSCGVTSRIVCIFPLCHVIYHSCDKGSWRQLLLSTTRCCNVCGRNLITVVTSVTSPRVDILSTSKVGQKLGVCLFVDMLAPGVTILSTVPQRSEIPEGLTNYPVL